VAGGSNGHFHIAPLELVQAVSESTFDVLSCVLLSFARAGHVLRPQPSVLSSLLHLRALYTGPGGLGGYILPIVESRESKTRSEEGILPSFRISKHKSLKTQNISPDFLWLGRQTRHLHLSSSFRPLPRALLMCFHVICPVLRASAVSSVHTRRCSHQCSPPTTLAEDLAPISGSKQPARVLRGLEAPSRCWRSSQ